MLTRQSTYVYMCVCTAVPCWPCSECGIVLQMGPSGSGKTTLLGKSFYGALFAGPSCCAVLCSPPPPTPFILQYLALCHARTCCFRYHVISASLSGCA